MRFFWRIVVLLLISISSGAEGKALAAVTEDAKQRAEERRQQQLPPDQPIDFFSLRKKSDELSARQHSDFKLHQAEVEFDSNTLRINQVNFHYFHPTPVGGADFEMGEVAGKHQYWEAKSPQEGLSRSSYPGTIAASRQAFGEPLPTAAPANILNPEEAVRRLNRAPLTSPFSAPSHLKDPSRWKLNVQLIRVGRQYMAGTVTLSPAGAGRLLWIQRAIQPSIHDPFFRQTAPAGKWVWWTIAQHTDVPGERYEYIYMDVSMGKATSHCAEPSGPRDATVAMPVPCTPPAKGR